MFKVDVRGNQGPGRISARAARAIPSCRAPCPAVPHPVHSFPPRHRADARGDATTTVDRAELTAAGNTLTLALDNQVVGSWSVQPAATPPPSMSPSAPAASPTVTASGSSPITSPTSSTRATPAATPTGVPSAIVTPELSSHKEATPAGSTTGHAHGTDDDSSTSQGGQIVTSSPSRGLALPATGN